MPCMTFRRGTGGAVYDLWTVLLVILASIALSACRQEMANQPRYDPYDESTFFSDRLSARPLPIGTVPRNSMGRNTVLDSGITNGEPAAAFPFPVTMDVLQRGRQRYNIYCVPCHGFVGFGDGMAARRGFRRPPTSFHIDRLRQAPPGHFFDVITNGFGAMPSYAFQIEARDRWAIVSYVRALQLSQAATMADVPSDELQRLQSSK
jgi:mono/diheme cytochrome c family protein